MKEQVTLRNLKAESIRSQFLFIKSSFCIFIICSLWVLLQNTKELDKVLATLLLFSLFNIISLTSIESALMFVLNRKDKDNEAKDGEEDISPDSR